MGLYTLHVAFRVYYIRDKIETSYHRPQRSDTETA